MGGTLLSTTMKARAIATFSHVSSGSFWGGVRSGSMMNWDMVIASLGGEMNDDPIYVARKDEGHLNLRRTTRITSNFSFSELI